jgi:hypothetical protein
VVRGVAAGLCWREFHKSHRSALFILLVTPDVVKKPTIKTGKAAASTARAPRSTAPSLTTTPTSSFGDA